MKKAFGEMDIEPNAFYAMTWKEFFLKHMGWSKKYWNVWEQTRLIAYTTAATSNRSKRMFPKMTKWLRLPTDAAKEKIDAEDFKKIFELARQKVNGK